MTDNSSPASRAVLVVDDEPHIRQVLALKLRAAGYEVYLAEDGRQALDIAREEHPDVIISDFRMPNRVLPAELLRDAHAECRNYQPAAQLDQVRIDDSPSQLVQIMLIQKFFRGNL